MAPEADALRTASIQVSPQRSAHGGITVRFPRFSARDLLMEWNAWKQLLNGTDIDNYLDQALDLETSQVKIVYMVEKCPVHGYRHVQIVPLDKEPMTCADAVKSQENHKAW